MMTLIKGAIVIKQFHLGKEQFVAENVRTACGTDLNTFPGASHFLVQTFLSTVNPSLKDGSLLLCSIYIFCGYLRNDDMIWLLGTTFDIT